MGDRANVFMVEPGQKKKPGEGEELKGVYLYTHWGGMELAEDVGKALDRGRNRWDDSQYLARVIFCEMMRHDGIDGITGLGITAALWDNEHPLICIDSHHQEITFLPYHYSDGVDHGTILARQQFGEFVRAAKWPECEG